MHIHGNYRLSELHPDCFFYDRFHVCAIHLVHSHFYDAPQFSIEVTSVAFPEHSNTFLHSGTFFVTSLDKCQDASLCLKTLLPSKVSSNIFDFFFSRR